MLEFFLVLFSGYVVFRREISEDRASGFEFNFFVTWLAVPVLATLVITFLPKEWLIKRQLSQHMDTLYFKSNLLFTSSKAYALIQILQKLVFAAVIVYIDDITTQACAMILTNLLVSWVIMSIDQIYLDKHLKAFERINQGLLSLVQIILVLMTDYVDTRTR